MSVKAESLARVNSYSVASLKRVQEKAANDTGILLAPWAGLRACAPRCGLTTGKPALILKLLSSDQ